jgi:hypothetical protein
VRRSVRKSLLTIGGRTMLIERGYARLTETWIHLRDSDDSEALCGERNLRPATPREANAARGTCPDCTRRQRYES